MENKKDLMYEILKNKKVIETKLTESPVKSAKHVSGLPKKQVELEGHLSIPLHCNEVSPWSSTDQNNESDQNTGHFAYDEKFRYSSRRLY